MVRRLRPQARRERPPQSASWLLLVVSALSQILGSLGGVAWLSWMADLGPMALDSFGVIFACSFLGRGGTLLVVVTLRGRVVLRPARLFPLPAARTGAYTEGPLRRAQAGRTEEDHEA